MKEYVMDAVFDEKTYKAFISGAAVDNNGLRSPKGHYWPNQPSYRPRNDRQEALKDAGTEILIAAGAYAVRNIILPACKRFVDHKVYPFVVEKFDNWKNSKNESVAPSAKKELATDGAAPVKSDKVVYLDQYRKIV